MEQQIDMMQVLRDIVQALRQLGYTPGAHSAYVTFPLNRPATQFDVVMDGEPFGVWDAEKKTFVD